MNELEFLLKLSAQAQMFTSDKIRAIKMQELEAKAHFYGYSFAHFASSGTWRKYEEIKPVENPCNSVENRVFASIEAKAICKNCGKDFMKKRPNKVFCSELCKNKFHNLNK